MQEKSLEDNGTFVLKLEPGEEVTACLADFAKRHGVGAARFSAIGVLSDVTWGFYDRELGDYRKTTVREDVEVLSLTGNITLLDNRPFVHAHVSVAGYDGVARGGHLFEAHVWPTLEVMLVAMSRDIARVPDPDMGFALLSI